MAKHRKAEPGELRLAIFRRYGVLIDASNGFPDQLPPESEEPESETYESWCARVLGCDVTDVAFFAHSLVTPKTSMRRLREASPDREVAEMLVAQQRATERALDRRHAERPSDVPATRERPAATGARTNGKGDERAPHTEMPDVPGLVGELRVWIDSTPDLDAAIRSRVFAMLDSLHRGRSLASVIQDVLLLAPVRSTSGPAVHP
jgi:hypothetical protein